MTISDHKYSKPYKRKMILGKDEWSWRVAGEHVWIRLPSGKKTWKTDVYELNGITQEQYLKNTYDPDGLHNYPPNPQVRPSDIKNLILSCLKF